MLETLRRDVRAVLDRDPAARSALEVILLYPGLHAVWAHRISHWLWSHRLMLLARACSTLARLLTGVDIHPGAVLGGGLFIDHATGVVIGETAEAGENVTLYQGVTLGGTRNERGKRHPSVGDRVTIGAGAKVLGPIVIGDDSRIGANAVVVKPVPANSVVVGVPGQIIVRSRLRASDGSLDLDGSVVPALFGASLESVLSRIDRLEDALPNGASPSHARPSPSGVWSGEDFSI